MRITASLFEASLKCPTKCWLRAAAEPPSGNAYAEWVETQNESYRRGATAHLLAQTPQPECVLSPPADTLKTAKWRFAVNVALSEADRHRSSLPQEAGSSDRPPASLELQPKHQRPIASPATDQASPSPTTFAAETHLHALERVPSGGRGKAAQFIPIRFIFRNKLTRDDKLLLAFDTSVLAEVLGRELAIGKILHGDDHAALKVKTSALAGEVRKRVSKIAALLSRPAPPDLVLNRHCAECEFQSRCRQKALEKDDLSLLAGMSEKERKKLHSKGIFTVTQLSYTFRPRRRPKRLRDKREKYHHSLKALAIREKKIHVVGTPELKIQGTPVYLDVEGLPDRDFYYLIGLRIGHGESAVQHSLWADTVADEERIWREFLAILGTVEKPVLIHYGSYETTFLKRMCGRYGPETVGPVQSAALQSAINLLSVIFAQVYFPTFSNGLKHVADYLNFQWRELNPSGLLAVVLRMNSVQFNDATAKARLTTYNQDDCEALALVADVVSRLREAATDTTKGTPSPLETVQVDSLRDEVTTKWDRFRSPISEFEVITKAAHWDYQRDRVHLRVNRTVERIRQKARRTRKAFWHVDKVLAPPTKLRCPRCGRKARKKGSLKTRKVQDIVFGRNSMKRRVFRFQSQPCWCPRCDLAFQTDRQHSERRHYGRNLMAYLFYQRIGLCIPGQVVVKSFNRLFGYGLTSVAMSHLKQLMSSYYQETQQLVLRRIVAGPLVHVDETFVSIQGKRAYVWVFASLHEVVYLFCDNREGAMLHETLRDFKGVLVSDFYAVYDSCPCPQQKCLIHLIRDLNTALLDFPYDEELKIMVEAFAGLTQTIIQTVDRVGLKRHFLSKHQREVDQFYRDFIDLEHHTEAAVTWKDRFQRNRDKLFTFLHHDGVPWNNNAAEHAIKAFARLRDVIEGSSTEKGICEYLILLSVCQTCEYMGLDFLDFLRTGEKDIHAFAERQRGRRGQRHRSGAQEPLAEGASA